MRALLLILSDPTREAWAQQLAMSLGATNPILIIGGPLEAARHLSAQQVSPSHIVLDIGRRSRDILTEIDELAQQCEPGTRVVAVGDTNDIQLYREILARGVLDYLPMPAAPQDILRAFSAPAATPSGSAAPAPIAPINDANKRVIVFMSAASGDGASTVALNTAYALSQINNGNTVLVDMDYQFGMVAKNLALQNQYGIRDLFDHPERGIDTTLIKRMVASYGKLHVITAPAELRYLPTVSAEAIRELITILKANYDNVVIDLPHVWLPWVATATQQATHLVLVSQLWLKSVSHASRMMRALRELHIPTERITAVINRSGAKYKEAIEPKDFERVCGVPIRYNLANDIKTIVTAEGSASTVMELSPTELSADIQRLTHGLAGITAPVDAGGSRGGLFSKRRG